MSFNMGQDPNATPTPTPQPVQPNPAQNPAQQNAAPKPQQPQPNSAALNPNTNPVHRSLFDKIFTGLGGGPRYVTQMGPNGTPVTTEVPTSKGDITRSLLAGVIHGMISGYQAGNNTPAGPLGTRSAGIANGLAAGNAAAAANQQQFKNAPQAAMDADMARKATVMNNNVQELKNQLAIGQLHNADWDAQEGYYEKTGDAFAPVLDNILKSQADSGITLIDPNNTQLSHDEAIKRLAGHMTDLTAVQDGWTTETHADGRTYHVPTFSLVKHGDVQVNRDTILALSPYDQGVKQILDKTNGDITLSTGQLLSIEKSAQAAHAGYEALHQWQTSLGVAPEDQLSQSKFNELYRTNPALKRQVGTVLDAVGNINTQSTDHALAQLINPANKNKTGEFVKLLGVPNDEIQSYVDDAEAAHIAKDAKAKNGGKPMTAAIATSILADPSETPERRAAAQAVLKSETDQKGANKSAELTAAEQADRKFYAGVVAADKTGWNPDPNSYLTQKEYNTARQKFASPTGAYGKAQDVEKSYQMMQSAYNEYQAAAKQGKVLPTGAQSMLALSTHLATTFGGVKGSRITKDMITHHMGARSISDDGLVAIQKLTNGDVLSPAQWSAFNDLVSQSRKLTWDNVVADAHAQGLPADNLPKGYVPVGAVPGRDPQGNIVGYKLPNGQVVRF